ncbi:MAG TPA: hypothetical protein VE869_02920 [Gemmatimonas sp.]|nr:hypothetical protein [Gemmatimonas sp.]
MAKTTMSLDDLVTQLRAVHGPELIGVVLYGSAASDEAVEGRSDKNVLLVVSTLSMDVLRKLAQTSRAWQEAGNPPPLIFTLEEWKRSSDIFPMEYADILERHRVLHGTMPLEGIHIDQAHLRLQTEQEAMGKMLRLRRAVMTAGTDTSRQQELLRASFSALLVIFRAVLRLHGVQPPRDAVAVVQAVGERGGFDVSAFEHVAGLVRGRAIAERDTDAVLTGYVRGMDDLVHYLDRFAPPAAA